MISKIISNYIALVLIIKVFKSCHCQKMTGKIVGGTFGSIQEFPHAVFLNGDCGTEKYICGASILNQNILLTAAHCIEPCDLRNCAYRINAIAGSANIEDHENVVQRRIFQAIVHENYDELTVSNDIALAMTDTPFLLSNNVKRVAISRRFPRDSYGVVAGWGIVEEKTYKRLPQVKFVEQHLVSRQLCSKYIDMLEPGMFCAGSLDPDADRPSLGDSGSGLLAKNYKQIGLVSYRDMTQPALLIYSNISFYYDFISRTAKKLWCNKEHKCL